MLNKACIIGNLGNDPEVRHFDNGGQVANFSVATSENWTDKNGEKQSRTEWHQICCFGKLAEIVEKYVKKGDRIYLEGKIRTRSYEQNGETKYTTEIHVEQFGGVLTMLGGNKSESTQTEPANTGQGSSGAAPLETDDLPF